MSPTEPSLKRTVSFIDGQNLYHSVRESFGYTYPNYDVKSLSQLVCQRKGWDLIQTRFYTGVPDQSGGPFWNYFWTHKLAMPGPMGYWGKKFKVFIIRDGKLIVQTWIQHFPTRSFQALEGHVNEIKTGLISPDAEVLLDEKEASICGKGMQPMGGDSGIC
jgi:hypothetical protein